MSKKSNNPIGGIIAFILLLGVAGVGYFSGGYQNWNIADWKDKLPTFPSLPSTTSSEESSSEDVSSEASSETTSSSESSEINSSEEPSSEEPAVIPHSDDTYPEYLLFDEGSFVDFTNQSFLNQTGWTTYNERTFTTESLGDGVSHTTEFYSNAARAYSITDEATSVTTKYLRLGWTTTSLQTMKQDLPFLNTYSVDGYRYSYLVSHFFNTRSFEFVNFSFLNSNLGSVGLTKTYVRAWGEQWEELSLETPYEAGVGYQIMFAAMSKNTTASVDIEYIYMGS